MECNNIHQNIWDILSPKIRHGSDAKEQKDGKAKNGLFPFQTLIPL